MVDIKILSQKLQIPERGVAGAVQLLEDGNTLPFIARYRKEATGGLDEEQLRRLQAEWGSLKTLEERRAAIAASLRELGVYSDELGQKIAAAPSLTVLEDLYLPHRPKRKTRAGMARERGLQGLADRLLSQPSGPLPSASPEDWAGARDIVAEHMAERPEIRGAVRDKALRFGRMLSKRAKGDDEREVYSGYYAFQAAVAQLRPHQVLALDRGEAEKVLSVSVELEERDWRPLVWSFFRPRPGSPWGEQLTLALEDGAKRLLLPAIERDVRRHLSESAQRHAIENFAANLHGLLNTPPLAGHTVLGIDPGFRTGCKLALVDPTGKLLATDTLFLHQERQALATLERLCREGRATLIAIGNGTASRETERLVAELVRGRGDGLAYLLVSEAGASVYSASPLARAELPELDVTLRGAVSIARRVQDPLAELVKIEPRSIGVGMYQHDLDPKELDQALTGVVETVVNRVGVDLNTASPALLGYVAGIGPKLAERIVAFRERQGAFQTRVQLQQVSGLGPKAYEQAAGFLRIRGGREALDASAIHPESYAVARQILTRPETQREAGPLSRELGVGEPTVRDILEQLARPGRDPRSELPPPLLRQDVLKLDDLVPGLALSGTVRNVVDFGAFVDLGVKQDGLLHRSQLPRGQRLQVGQVVEVEVLEVDSRRGRISLGWLS